ncbi:hypothetical protein C9374_003998 [Naegleria lovaniensis]|uniref:Uncharacterized protein n=1 Tax=Naegleria lovaniensis TaxID=51637 RepID=A0AA88H6M6_NAELO|nr:uncharacterized protein C9374_003998 [Naegleria lovaniensis]KAG2394234.1 hypothetical protein C9374_003998 [Naegleria lovaniensis]
MPKNKSKRSGNTKTRFPLKDEDDDTQDSETLNHVQVKSIPTLNDSKKQTKKQFNASPSNHGSTLSKSHHDDHDDDDTLKSEIDMIHTSSTTPVHHEEEEEQELSNNNILQWSFLFSNKLPISFMAHKILSMLIKFTCSLHVQCPQIIKNVV